MLTHNDLRLVPFNQHVVSRFARSECRGLYNIRLESTHDVGLALTVFEHSLGILWEFYDFCSPTLGIALAFLFQQDRNLPDCSLSCQSVGHATTQSGYMRS